MFTDTLRLSVLPARAIVRLQLGARSQKTVNALKVAGRPMPVAVNSWSGDDPIICRIAPDTWLFSSALHEAAEIVPAVRTGCGRRSFCCHGRVGFARDALDRGHGRPGPARPRMRPRPVRRRVRQPGLRTHAPRATAGPDPAATPERFECVVDRSAAQWLYDWLVDAAAGLWAGHR